MAVINHESREVTFKLVYCGTPMGGKTTNLTWIHQRLGRERRGDLVTLATSGDRTLFFDFLPVHSMTINGYHTKFMLYTVPGQVHYHATRQTVLCGVDGIVFVADSQLDRSEENLTSWQGLQRNLEELGLSQEKIPLVMQWNKRDLPGIAPVKYLDYLLNKRVPRRPVFEACASEGKNVLPTLNALAQQVLTSFHQSVVQNPAALPF